MSDRPNTDDADWQFVLLEVAHYAIQLEPEARILGNIRAKDIIRAIYEAYEEASRGEE